MTQAVTVTNGVGAPPTMSSREIAKLTGASHANTLTTVRGLIAKGIICGNETTYKHPQNGQTYKEFQLNYRDTMIVASGYSVELRAKVIDRWQELEAQVANPAAVNLSDAAALRGLLLDYTEQVMQLEHQVSVQAVRIAEDAPKIETYTKLVESRGCISFQQFCTKLNLHQVKVKKWLRDIGWLRNNQWQVNPLPTAKAVDAGYCVIKNFVTESGLLVQSIKFTGKAEIYVYENAPDYIRKTVRATREIDDKKAA